MIIKAEFSKILEGLLAGSGRRTASANQARLGCGGGCLGLIALRNRVENGLDLKGG